MKSKRPVETSKRERRAVLAFKGKRKETVHPKHRKAGKPKGQVDLIAACPEGYDGATWNELTPKLKLFVAHLFTNGFNATQAAIDAGAKPGPGTRVTACRMLTNANIAINELLEMKGVTPEVMAERMARGVNATMPVVLTDEEFEDGKLVRRTQRIQETDDLKTSHRFLSTRGRWAGWEKTVIGGEPSGKGPILLTPETSDTVRMFQQLAAQVAEIAKKVNE